jgi:Spy/CpxP family protein refolding chaperone
MAKIMLVIGFLIAFAAGLTVGLGTRGPSIARGPEAGGPGPTTRRTLTTTRISRSPGEWFASQLNLSPDQQQKMAKIWSEVARGSRQEMEKGRDDLRKQRDEAIVALIGPEKKPEYDQIRQNYRDEEEKLERKMRERFENAVKQTEAILNPEQQAKYKELLARHRPPGERSPGGPGGPRGDGFRSGPDGFRGPGPGGPERHNLEHRSGDGGATPSTRP